jgi:hypothetical protein
VNPEQAHVFGPGPAGGRPRRCPWCSQARWVLMGGNVWWCTVCDGAVPLPGPKSAR